MIRDDQPKAGFFKMQLRSGARPVGVCIWHGAPLDPVTGEELDRSHRWQAMVNDRPIDLDRVWPQCAGEEISLAEYQRLSATEKWARENAPNSSAADPRKKVDWLQDPMPL